MEAVHNLILSKSQEKHSNKMEKGIFCKFTPKKYNL